MLVNQEVWQSSGEGHTVVSGGECRRPALVLAFAGSSLVPRAETWERLRGRWPGVPLVVASTAGEIAGTRVLDESIVATAVEPQQVDIRCARVKIRSWADSEDVGRALATELRGDGLRHVLVLSDGLKVNGSALVRGLMRSLPEGTSLSGGLCGDGARFERTHLCLDTFDDVESVVGIGFYGAGLRVGLGSLGGWDSFGPERRVTSAEGNVLFELDGQSALALYERYLGEHAAGLPASGLLFPLTVRASREDLGVVRTILSVDRQRGSLTFAGDVPVGHYARLMRANFDRLVEGAGGAAVTSHQALGGGAADLAILISCVGRKLVLKQRIEEEVESVRRVVGPSPVLTGFYSYGEISPFTPGARCELHNQTMTITTLAEG
jgi:hypothetical protein